MSIKSKIESLLFISNKPFSSKKLAEIIEVKEKEAKEALDELYKEYNHDDKGVKLVKIGSQYQMATSPDNAKLVQEYVKEEVTGELTRPSLETLTIIAYRGPISKLELEQIRGVNCSMIIRNLLIRGLVEAKEDKNKMETYYTITFEFMKYLGISDVNELPDYDKLSKNEILKTILDSTEEKTETVNTSNEELSEAIV